MIPILTCTAVSAESLSPGGANVEAYRAGPSSHAVPGSAKGGTWQHTQIPSGMGSTSGRQPGWPSRQQGSPGYGGGVSTPNYYSHDARPTRPRAPMITPYDAYIPARHPPRPSWQQNDSVYAGGASVPIYGDREARPAWPPAPIEPQYGVVTPAPIEPQYGGVITRESVYPGWTSWRQGNSGHGGGAAVPIYEGHETRPVWTHAPIRPQYRGGTTGDSNHSGWQSSQQGNSGYGGNGSAANYGDHQAQSTWSQNSTHSQNAPGTTGNRVHPSPAGGAAGPRRVY
jgi:hypothetical protein